MENFFGGHQLNGRVSRARFHKSTKVGNKNDGWFLKLLKLFKTFIQGLHDIVHNKKNWKSFYILIKSLCWDKRGKYQYILYADDIHSFLMFLFCLPKTNKMHANIQISIAVNPSAFGEFVVMLLKMLISTRNSVISKAIRPKNQTSLFVNI